MKLKSIINILKFREKETSDLETEQLASEIDSEETTADTESEETNPIDLNSIDSNFTTLAPTILEGKALKENKIYLESLQHAVQIPENKNIALMGSYGSGKSSIIKTFEKNHPEYKYLFLSLASFIEKENNDGELIDGEDGKSQSTSSKENKLETWEKIEKILVKQMIYKKTIRELPYSRFSRITKLSNWTLFFNAVLIFLLISMLTNVRVISEKFDFAIITDNFLFVVVAFISTYFIYLTLKYLTRVFKLSKFSFKSFVIEPINDESSYFSKYLDEIIYYFEVSQTDIVVIEDIDRFNSIVIFEHLRELNYLLNNSNQIDQPVRFIYAVRDDLFNNKGEPNLKESEEYLRTKFFDFIIPVIPVVDYMNSREFLIPKVKSIINNKILSSQEDIKDSIDSDQEVSESNETDTENSKEKNNFIESERVINERNATIKENKDESEINSNFKLNSEIEKFLMNISLYIDDLRLIYNICNEFEVYIKKLSHIESTEDLMKLFSLIVYKNIYPEDFASLQRNHGNIYNVFHSIKKSILNDVKRAIDEEIKRENDILNGSNYEVSMSARTALIQMCLREFGKDISLHGVSYNKDSKNSYNGMNLIPLKDSTINDFMTAQSFIELKYSNTRIEVPKDKIEKYFNRFGVHTNKIIGELEEEERKERERRKKELESDKNFISTISVKEIFNKEYDGYSKLTEEFVEYNLLMGYLLSEGYIDETFNYYISNLYGGVLTANDMTIIKKIKSNTPLDEADELNDYELAIHELTENDYRKTAILNRKIIIYIFNDSKHDTEQISMANAFIHKLDNKKKTKLLRELFEQSHDQIKRFVSLLLHENTKVYSELYDSESTNAEFNKSFEYHIFGSSDSKLLQRIVDDNPMLQPNVENIGNFVLNLYKDFSVNEKELNDLFSDNSFKFKEAGLSEMSDSYFEYYVNNHLYQINSKNVFDIYERIANNSHAYFSLTELLASEIENLIQHIGDYFDEYVQLLNDRENLYEEGNVLIRIINESEVSKELKKDIIKNNEYVIDDITAINDLGLRRTLFHYEKYEVCLKNVMKADDEDFDYISPYFGDELKIKQFVDEASDMLESDDSFKEELQTFLIRLVNEYGQEVNEKNIELFKYVEEYSTDEINDRTFDILLDCDRVKPTIENINKLSGKNKIKLMTADETTVSEDYQSIILDDEEIIMGITMFDGELLDKTIAASFENRKLIISNKVEWLEIILNRKIELSAEQINSLFSEEELLEDDKILDYLIFMIPKNIILESDLLKNIYSIDESLEAIQRGSYKKNRVHIKYYELLKALEEEQIIAKAEIENDEVVFSNKRK